MSCSNAKLGTMMEKDPTKWGACYWTDQDEENRVHGDGFYIGYFTASGERAKEVGDAIVAALKEQGVTVEWDGDTGTRIYVESDEHQPRVQEEEGDEEAAEEGDEEAAEVPSEDPNKPACQLSGTDGNVFAIIGKVRGALNSAGLRDKAKEFQDKALKAGSYDEVLAMCCDYVDVR
jgi:hypothetical protein